MSTIHSTFNRVNTSYTVIGGQKQTEGNQSTDFISVLLLSRGGRPFREELVRELLNLGVYEIISVQVTSKNPVDFEKESLNNEYLRSIIIKDKVSTGEIINIGISECLGDFVFILWDDMNIDSKTISNRVIEKIKENNRLCTAPVFRIKGGELLPTVMTPLYNKGLLKVIPFDSNKSLKSIYPFQYTGIYNREKFIKLGGYDINIGSSYWQKLDFGFRANMWGEEIVLHKSFQIEISSKEDNIEDITPDEGYKLYSLKNLSVIMKKDYGFLPSSKFFSYFDKSGSSLIEAYRTFKSVKNWVKKNRFRFKLSATQLTEDWDKE